MMLQSKANTQLKWLGWMLLILLAAVTLRLFALTDIPPGLTHDEADHGITAVSILEGTRDIYFSIGHGREPLYDYATAVLMAGVGQTYLAGRLTAVFFSLILITGMAAWVRRAFSWQTAVLTAAGLAVGFWPLMAARQSLRSITLPALFVLAVFFFWRGLENGAMRDWGDKEIVSSIPHHLITSPLKWFLVAGILLGLTFYTYIPARALWLLFPLTWFYVWLTARPFARKSGKGMLLMQGVAGLIGLPLFRYLQSNADAEIRIRELSAPLTAVTRGDFSLLWQNISSGLGIITWAGDDFWRYNIPGRPLLLPLMSILFIVGLGVAFWLALRPFVRKQDAHPFKSTACFLALLWLFIGLAPVLVTGASLSTTQAMGMQPVLYLFPALAIGAVLRVEIGEWRLGERCWVQGLVIVLFVGTAVFTVRDYFMIWANAPEVRVQYESAMATAVRYFNGQESASPAISTITPAQFHTPALAAMMLTNDKVTLRWFDGRSSLLIPNAEEGQVVESGFAPVAEAFNKYRDIGGVEIIPLPDTDLDRPLLVQSLNASDWLAKHRFQFTNEGEVQFGEAATFLGYDLRETAVIPGETIHLVTLWRLEQAVPDVRLFTHISGADGIPFAQTDGLSAPSESWLTGDLLLQLHEIVIPMETAVGDYPITIGLYTCQNADCTQTERLPVHRDEEPIGDHLFLQNLTVVEE